MKAHLLKHGMNTYSMKTCSYCDYSTHKTSILNKHLRTHSGEKMFLCDLCPKSYTSAVYLKEHKVRSGSWGAVGGGGASDFLLFLLWKNFMAEVSCLFFFFFF